MYYTVYIARLSLTESRGCLGHHRKGTQGMGDGYSVFNVG